MRACLPLDKPGIEGLLPGSQSRGLANVVRWAVAFVPPLPLHSMPQGSKFTLFLLHLQATSKFRGLH